MYSQTHKPMLKNLLVQSVPAGMRGYSFPVSSAPRTAGSGQRPLGFGHIPFYQRAHAVPVLGQAGAVQAGQDSRNILGLRRTYLGESLDALPGRNGLFVCYMAEKLR